MSNRRNQKLMRDVHIAELRRQIAAREADIERVRLFLADDASVISYQSLGQYRAALRRLLEAKVKP